MTLQDDRPAVGCSHPGGQTLPDPCPLCGSQRRRQRGPCGQLFSRAVLCRIFRWRGVGPSLAMGLWVLEDDGMVIAAQIST